MSNRPAEAAGARRREASTEARSREASAGASSEITKRVRKDGNVQDRNWKLDRGDGVMEVDFHWAEKGSQWEPKPPYHERMAGVYSTTLRALENAYQNGVERIIFIHGWSTSRPGKETSRSVVRGVMRSKHATPYICRRECIQHETVFVAAIRPR